MRPRVFPAEDDPGYLARDRDTLRFNEAAGIPRGRPTVTRTLTRGTFMLQ